MVQIQGNMSPSPTQERTRVTSAQPPITFTDKRKRMIERGGRGRSRK